MIEIREIDAAHKADINIPNEPFKLFGRMVPSYVDEQWSCRTVFFDEKDVSEMCFPDENYDFDAMKRDHVFLGACKFYIKAGFHIGGLDTNVYKGTSQEGKADILFYMDV